MTEGIRLRPGWHSGLLERLARREVALEVERIRLVREVVHGLDELPEGVVLVFHDSTIASAVRSRLHGQRPTRLHASRNPRTAAGRDAAAGSRRDAVRVNMLGLGMPPAALLNVPANVGYPLLFLLVGAESAGALLPGETALIVAAALASQGRLSLPLVIAVAAGAAILGDNIGYLIGRRGLRRLIDRPGRWAAGRRRLVERGEVFFARRGPSAVFFGRWLPGLRVVASWLAGANRMPWPRFLVWNALGGIAWASTVGTLAYLLGRSASGSLGAIGFIGVGVAVVVYLIVRLRRRHPHTG